MSPAQATFESIPNNVADKWWNDKCLRKNVYFALGCMMCPFYLGYDQALLTGLQALPEWGAYFNNPSSDLLGLMAAAIFLPGIVIGFPAAWVCGHWGRKICVLIGAVVMIVGAIFNAFSANSNQFIGSRVLLGVGGAITKVAAPSLLQEITHPRLRAPLGNMYFGFYYLGSLTSAIWCIIGLYIPGEWSWRAPCIFMIVGPILVISILITAPESPRYLVSKDKTEEALEMLAKFHANGARDDPLVQWEFGEIKSALEQEQLNNQANYLDFFRTPGNRKRLAVSLVISVGVNWVGNGIVSYYLSPVLKSVGVTRSIDILAINAAIALWNLIIAEYAGMRVDDFGRRPLFLISTVGMICSYACVMGLSAGFDKTGTAAMGIAAIPFLFFFYGFYDMAWTPLNYSYCVEIMPFNLRAKGLAIYQSVQQVANAFNQFVNPIALDALAWRYYAVYIGVDIVYVFLIYFFFPETKKLTIEEIALIFDYDTKEGREQAAAALQEAAHDEDKVGPGAKHAENVVDYSKAQDGDDVVSYVETTRT